MTHFENSFTKGCQVELVETGSRNEIAFDKFPELIGTGQADIQEFQNGPC